MIQSANIVAFAAKLTFTLAATFTRLSLISFYYRLIKDSGVKWFSWVLHVSMAYTIAVCVKFVALTIWLCSYVIREVLKNWSATDAALVPLNHTGSFHQSRATVSVKAKQCWAEESSTRCRTY